MNNICKLLLMLFAAPLFVSCFEDETSDATRPLSEITVKEGSIKDVYNIYRNETVTIVPEISQSNKEKPLTYTWEIDLEAFSNEKDFNFVGKELGSFNCRFIVENEDGKTFVPFKLNVNSPYEEGITVLSKDADGRPMLAFMQKPFDASEPAKFTTGELLTLNNSDIYFSSNPVDFVQSSNSLIIACQGNGTGEDVPTFYYLNEKTFIVENMFSVTEYDNFKPTRMLVPSVNSVGGKYPLLCEDGKVYEFSAFEAAVQPSTLLLYTYSQAAFVADDGSSWYFDAIIWDKAGNALTCIYNGYGPYCFSEKYHLLRSDASFDTDNYFAKETFVTMIPIRMTAAQRKLNGSQGLLICGNSRQWRKIIFGTGFWGHNYETNENYLLSNGGITRIENKSSSSPMPIDENTPCIANDTYDSFLFADGNKVRRWNYFNSTEKLTAAPTLLTVGSENAVIKSFEMTDDHTRTYVAFYEPDQTGLNGSVWVFDTDKGEVLEKYDNVCYEPVKMIYKKK